MNLQLDTAPALTNSDKVLYPSAGFTKADVADYLVRVSTVLLPHLRGYPLSMKRYPNGVDGAFFFEKRCPPNHPDFVATKALPSKSRGVINFCLADNVQTLLWLANLACLELHTYLARAGKPDTPTRLVFDLDPGAPAALPECARVALMLRDALDGFKLRSFAKTSGGKGLHVYVPLNLPIGFDETKIFAHALAEVMRQKMPRLVTSVMAKKERPGKVFIDWSQNDRGKTTVCAYSLRAQAFPSVSTPITWDEVAAFTKPSGAKASRFLAQDVLRRVEQHGDLFAPVLTLKQKLPSM